MACPVLRSESDTAPNLCGGNSKASRVLAWGCLCQADNGASYTDVKVNRFEKGQSPKKRAPFRVGFVRGFESNFLAILVRHRRLRIDG